MVGQWIWTARDVRLFADARVRQPALLPAVLSATVRADLSLRRGLSPAVGGVHAAVVVRLEDGVSRALEQADGAERLDRALTELVAEIRAAGVTPSEVELDYDAPVRSLAGWASVVRTLSRRSLRDYPVWITSIPAHLDDHDYGTLFRGSVRGHILQLFDTGLPALGVNVTRLGERLAAARLPFRVGIASFERGRGRTPATDHRLWARAAAEYARLPGFSGTMVFAASAPSDALERFAREPSTAGGE